MPRCRVRCGRGFQPLQPVLQKYHRHVSFPIRDNNILDHVYSNVRNCYKALDSLTTFPCSSIQLTRPFSNAQPVSKTVPSLE